MSTEYLTPRERKHVSVSELREFFGCPLRWHYRYGLGLFTDASRPFFALGRSVHAGLELWYLTEKTHGARDAERALGMYRSTWAKESRGVDWAAEAKDPLLVNTTGLGLLKRAMEEPDDWRAEAVEETLYADLVHSRYGKLPYPVKVKLDMRTVTNDVVEHKTADKRWEKGKEETDIQATAEALVVRENFAHDPSITFNILVANKTPDVDRRTTRRTQDDIDRLWTHVRALLRAEEQGAIYPNPTAFAHRECEFRQLCDGWTEHPQAVPSGQELQAIVPGLSDYNARVPGARWGGRA